MFFDDDDDEGLINPEIFHVVRRELYAVSSNIKVSPYGVRSAPTHTEDGIPIRKLYVCNLPPKTTRSELFGVFAPYGFIKNCWLRMSERGPNRILHATYAFVTFSNPEDAHKALQAPHHEKTLRGRILRTSPADSWHQPIEESDRNVHWKARDDNSDKSEESTNNMTREEIDRISSILTTGASFAFANGKYPDSKDEESEEVEENTEDPGYSIMDILNRDCLTHILSYVPLRDLILSERVSKSWQNMVQEYLLGIRMFKTSSWEHMTVTMTTAVLRRVLMRIGPTLVRLHIDHHLSALNDRTAHTICKFCPNLEELRVVNMHTKNWNPLVYGCKSLKNISFVSCNKLTDTSLVNLVKSDLAIESLTIANNTHVTGLFLTGLSPPKLNAVSFYNCYSLQGTVLCAAIDTLPHLTTLKVDVCPATMWTMIPLIISKLPKLVELSLSEFASVDVSYTLQEKVDKDGFCKALATLSDLKRLNLSRNLNITNAVLKQIAQSCVKLESLNISSCNNRRNCPHLGVSDEGVMAVCGGCVGLRRLDVSYLGALTDRGLHAVASLRRLTALTARGNPGITAAPVTQCLLSCHELEEVDLCGCDGVSEVVLAGAVQALEAHPRHLLLRLAATCASDTPTYEYPEHKLLKVNVTEDRSILQLRPDFIDRVFEDSSDDSFDDIYDHEDFNEFFDPDDELYLDDDLDNYERIYAMGIDPSDIILM
ncbi:hypothetical protein K1T71_009201 [Dendrolimus kikuchii]|uniref:Uncharacterized protein n=1 Tax=Dendrolimus kikuchii TaxID=765133 RepID=A0ACC1CU51_9NEOP|nr:hypothetical protein K1T71_009201 [Dendrolimus kikuchii]